MTAVCLQHTQRHPGAHPWTTGCWLGNTHAICNCRYITHSQFTAWHVPATTTQIPHVKRRVHAPKHDPYQLGAHPCAPKNQGDARQPNPACLDATIRHNPSSTVPYWLGPCPLASEWLDRYGLILIEDGQTIFLWVVEMQCPSSYRMLSISFRTSDYMVARSVSPSRCLFSPLFT